MKTSAVIHTRASAFAIAHLITFLIVLILPHQSNCGDDGGRDEVIFFSDPYYEGDRLFITLASGCYTIETDWDNRISSVDTQGACIIAYEEENCRGPSVKLAPGMRGLGNLGRLSFDNVLSSISACSEGVGLNKERNKEIDGPAPEIWNYAVEEHNKYRRIHGVPDFKGDPMLHRAAQRHADSLVRRNKFEASSDNKYGENLATSIKADKFDAVRDVIQRWYNKIEFYDFRNPESNKNSPRSGQFTSIIWKASTHMGIGVARDESEKKWVIVANYDPAAKRNQFKENVLPAQKGKQVQAEGPRIFRTSKRE